MNGKYIRIWKQMVTPYFKGTILPLAWRELVKQCKTSLRLADNLVKIQTRYLLNTGREHYCCTTLLHSSQRK